MILSEIVTYCDLERYPYGRACLVVLVGELDLTWTQITSFLRVCWHLSLVGSELEMRGYTRATCEQWLLLCSGDVITLWGLRQVPSYWTRSPEGIVWAGIFPDKYVLSLLPASVPLPQRWTMLGKCGHSAWFGAQLWQSSRGQRPELFPVCYLCKNLWRLLPPHLRATSGLGHLCV